MKAATAFSGVALTATLALAAATAGAADEGTVYRWVDSDGTPHYQDRPPEGDVSAAQELNVRYKLTDGQAVAAARKSKAEVAAAASLREQQQAADQAGENADREQVKGEREQGCQAARDKLAKYETAHRLYKPGPDGQRTYLTDEETDAARVAARRDVAEWCGE
jgi:hypothetical protein